MKTPLVLLVLVSALGLLLGTAGCTSHSARHYGRPTVALAITVNGAPPTPQQFDTARRKMLPQIESYGWMLLDNPEAAERIIRVDFVPDPLDPQNNGQVYVLGTYPNPSRRRTVVASTYYSTPYEFRDYYVYPGVLGYWGYYGYYHHHDGHWGAPSGSSSGGPSTSTPPPPGQTASTPPPPSSGRYSPPDDQPVRRGKYMRNEPVRRIDPPSSGSSSYSGGSSSYSSGSSSSSSGSSSSYSGGSSSTYSGGSSSSSGGSSWTPSTPASSDSSSSSARNGGERVEKER